MAVKVLEMLTSEANVKRWVIMLLLYPQKIGIRMPSTTNAVDAGTPNVSLCHINLHMLYRLQGISDFYYLL